MGSGSVAGVPGGKRRRVGPCRSRLAALREPPPPPVLSFIGCTGVYVHSVAVRHAPQLAIHLAHCNGGARQKISAGHP